MVTAGPRTRRRDEEERIILMKSRDRRALDFIRIIISFSSSPDFSTKNVTICDKYVSIWCHGGDHSKWSICFFVLLLYYPVGFLTNVRWKRAIPIRFLLIVSWSVGFSAKKRISRGNMFNEKLSGLLQSCKKKTSRWDTTNLNIFGPWSFSRKTAFNHL